MSVTRVKHCVTLTICSHREFQCVNLTIFGICNIGNVLFRSIIFITVFAQVFVYLIHCLD